VNDNGFLAVICPSSTANLEYLIIRQIMEISGYEINEENDYVYRGKEEDLHIRFRTNMPYQKHLEIEAIDDCKNQAANSLG